MYQRVIPRDLFNEASLLKCLGKLYIETEGMEGLELENDGEAFDVQQDENTGAILAANVSLTIRGEAMPLWRPLNSRYAWPLYMTTADGEEIGVFDDNGKLSEEMASFIKG